MLTTKTYKKPSRDELIDKGIPLLSAFESSVRLMTENFKTVAVASSFNNISGLMVISSNL